MSSNKTKPSFRSFPYLSGHVYNWLNRRLYDFDKKFMTLGKMVEIASNNTKNPTVLDLPCGTGYLARYLSPQVVYEGWDLNNAFLKKLRMDYRKGRLGPKKVSIRLQNIFDFDKYPKEKKDVIVFCGILHHIFPKHMDLVEQAKKHAKAIVVCEPYAIKPQDINAYDPAARFFIGMFKYLPERLFKYVDFFLADNDGLNPFSNRTDWDFDAKGLQEMYKSFGIDKTYVFMDECLGIWKE